MELKIDEAFQSVTVVRVGPGAASPATDVAATEEPMEIRLNGEPFAVIMRTPGEDRELTAGFLFAERVVHGPSDIDAIRLCAAPSMAGGSDQPPPLAGSIAGAASFGEPRRSADRVGGEAGRIELGERSSRISAVGPSAGAADGGQNVVDVRIGGDVSKRLAERRRVVMTAACGLCGRTSIESLRTEAAPITAGWTVPRAFVASLPGRLRTTQNAFDTTGGLHAAALFSREGALEAAAEDVGRHNAVDKIVGRMLLVERLPLSDSILVVSGRASFEIVQKAFLAGIPVVAAVSAPSSLAINLAREAGITLAGFVRGDTFNLYSGAERVT